tara:strand:- start:356 stop:955 length:600 start_codon:yes stop_codon:yes gene_type:complete
MNTLNYSWSVKKGLILWLVVLTSLGLTSKTFAKEAAISYPFTTNSAQYWQYSSDRVMGGISNGQVKLEQDGDIIFARLTGEVSTKNNGGFIQLRTNMSLADTKKNGNKLKGVRLNVRGNGETYYIFIRTNETRSYSDYYSATFKATNNWQMIDLPFNTFERKRSKNSVLQAEVINSLGIVAYGRDFTADVSVSTIEFYY